MNIEITEQYGEFESLKEIQLDKIVELQFNELLLKQNFEIIIKVLESHRAYMNRLNDKSKLHDNLLKEQNGDDNLRQPLEERIQQLELNLKNSDQKFDQFKNEFDEWKKSLDTVGEFNELKQQLSELRDQLNNMNEKNQAMNQEIQNLSNISNEQNGKLQQLNSAQQQLKDSEAQLALNDEKQQNSLNDIQKQIAQLESEIEELKQQISNNNNVNNIEVIPIINNTPTENNNHNSNNNAINELINQFKQLQIQLNKAKTNISDLTSTTNDIQDKMAQKSEVAKLQDDIEALRQELNNFNQQQYVKQEEFDNLKNIELPQQFSQLNNQIEDANNEIEQLKIQIQQLYDLLNKINSSNNAQPIEIPQLPAPVQNIDSGKLKQFENKLKNLENKILSLQQLLNEKQTKSDAKEAQDNMKKLLEGKLNRNEFNINPLQELLKTVQDNVDRSRKQIKKNANDITSLSEQISNQKPVIREKIVEKQPQQQQQPTVDENQLKTYFQTELNSLKDNLMKLIKDLQKKVDEKPNRTELQQLEEELKDILNNLLNELKKYVSKAEFRKIITQLEAKIRELQTMILGEKDKSLDGLFVKRPLAWSCASCDHNLDKFKGKLGEAVNWAVFPPKETSFISNFSPLRMGKYAMHYASEIAQKKLEILENSMNSQRPNISKTEANFFPSTQSHRNQTTQQQQQQTMSSTMTQFNQQSNNGLKVISKNAMPIVKRNLSTRNFDQKKNFDEQ